MEKYIPSGLQRKDGTDIMCLSYEYYLAHPEEFKYEREETKEDETKGNIVKEATEVYKIETNKKHDKLFKDLFSNKEEAAKFINKYLNLRIPIMSNMLEVYKTEFVSNLYETRESDIVYKVKNKNIFFLIEHQSKPDRSMPLRLYEYSTYIMKQAVEKEKMQNKEYKYPRVIKMVLYTGKETWNAKLTLDEIQDSLAGYKEEKEDYILVDANKYTKEELLADNLIITKAMLIEKSKTKEETIQNFEAIARVVIEKNMPLGEYLLKIMKEHILPQNLREETEEIIEKVKNEKGENKNMLAVVEMIEKENQSYIRKGYEQAKKEFEEIIKQKGKNLKLKEENKDMLAVVEMIEKENQSYIRKGRKEGYEQAKKEMALLLIERNIPIEEITKITGLSTTEIETIEEENAKVLEGKKLK